MRYTPPQNNITILRIWRSESNGGENVGHISLEIPKYNLYASLWPESEVTKKLAWRGHGTFSPVPHELHTPQKDLEAEGRAPEDVIALYSLNTSAMKDKFEQCKVELVNTGWQLFSGTLFFRNPEKNGKSCAGHVYDILEAGGIYDLTAKKFSSSASSAISPDMLATLVYDAKKQELATYESTADYQFETETNLPPPDKKACVIL